MHKKGRAKPPRGEAHPHAKLKVSDIESIRSRYASGDAQLKHLAAEFGVTTSAISVIVKGNRWRSVPLQSERERVGQKA
ncbi:hypothetical protein QEG98_28010 [Myxococcus sp. MxC21-1]|uniref:hypothetical protein n=1 Tax=Myxococcus sp. MxC21-1 TaxID=3041439 RepID=UPI00292E5942|nr:hypothetical protein [Myxococcus sp. MxC21-1]WNZ59850.1 hypothetical protein QEG98_28010 [Myxococcus sp. MxC21-1]